MPPRRGELPPGVATRVTGAAQSWGWKILGVPSGSIGAGMAEKLLAGEPLRIAISPGVALGPASDGVTSGSWTVGWWGASGRAVLAFLDTHLRGTRPPPAAATH